MAAEPKMRPTGADVTAFLNEVPNDQRRRDGFEILTMMQEISRAEPAMWGPSIIGFGRYRYVYESGHKGESPIVAFSPRKDSLVLYVQVGVQHGADLMEKLGKFKVTKGCLYIRKLDDVDRKVLREIVQLNCDMMSDQRVE